MRYADKHNAGRSKIVDWRPDEDAGQRHNRRYQAARRHHEKLKVWCAENGVSLTVHNDGQHWQLRKGDRFVDWWPSRAKCVVNKQWKEGIHTHDVSQLMEIAQRNFVTERQQ